MPDGMTPSLEPIAQRFRSFIAARKISQSDAARQAGVSSATLSEFLAGSERQSPRLREETERALERWMATVAEQEAYAPKLAKMPGFIETETSRRIWQGLTYAQVAGTILLVEGAAGLGKTETLRAYAQQVSSVHMVTCRPSISGLQPILQAVAAAIGVSAKTGHGGASYFEAIVHGLRGSNALLCLDEAQHLKLPALEELRAIHDQTGVGMALLGNARLYTQLHGNGRAADFAQLFSRFGKRISLRQPTVGDVAAIAAAWSVTDKAALRFLQEKRTVPGALRQISQALRLAAVAAAEAGAEVGREHLAWAWSDLNFEARAEG